MAQTGYTPILIYASGTTGNTPSAANLTSSASGAELALNYFDGKLFYKDASGNVQVLAGKGGSGVVAGSNTQVQFNNNGVFGASSGLTWDGTNLTASQLRSSGLTSGRVTYASTSGLLVDSANMTFNGTRLTVADLADSGLTAGRVTYASTGGALVDSSALTFDGAILGVNSVSVGRGAGAVSTNTAVGASALGNGSQSGTGQTAIGNQVLKDNTSGVENTGLGYAALFLNTTGNRNTALGTYALIAGTTGSDNVAVGHASLNSQTTGANNVAVGKDSLRNNTTASNNTAVGYQAGYNNTTGTVNTYFGQVAGYANTVGDAQAFFGASAGQNATGSSNTFIGGGAGYLVTTGAKNTVLGRYNGNQGGLDIRTANNYIVLSDGDGNPRIVVDGGGFGGIGVNPANQYAAGGGAAWQVGRSTNIWNYSVSGNDQTRIYNNAYLDTGAGERYLNTNAASRIQMADGRFFVASAGSGIAGNTVSFTNVIDVKVGETVALQGATSQTGTGITFPATQSASSNANTLDDYEEGSWTPTLSSTATAPTVTSYSDRVGNYTKVGNMVTVVCYIRATISAAGTGTPTITGLPFAPAGTLPAVAVGLRTLLSANPQAYVNSTETYFANATWIVANNEYIVFFATYQV